MSEGMEQAANQQGERVLIIAEIGSNYDGDLALAKRYVDAAKEHGADAVKFQSIRKDRLISPQVWVNGRKEPNPVWDRFSNLELPAEWHFELAKRAEARGLRFSSTPFYLEAVDLLEDVGVAFYKIASGDVTFLPLLDCVGRTGRPVILSTGASTLDEVRVAVERLERAGAKDVSLLHCVASYPAEYAEMNLRAIQALAAEFGRPVGISDHSPGLIVPVASVALGATVVEKHVTFDRAGAGPDHGFAMTFEEFGEMASAVRGVEAALGSGRKEPAASEQPKRARMRRAPYDPETHEPSTAPNAVWLRPLHG